MCYNYAVCFAFKKDIFTNSDFIEGIDYQFDQIEINKEQQLKFTIINDQNKQQIISEFQNILDVINSNIENINDLKQLDEYFKNPNEDSDLIIVCPKKYNTKKSKFINKTINKIE